MGSIDEVPVPLYTVQTIPGKGKGLIANHAISAGTRIISEPPLFTTAILSNPATVEEDLAKIVKDLPKDSQRAFLTLHNNFPGDDSPLSNIIRSNGYPLGPSSDIGGVFLETARINHSCWPNAQHAWNSKLERMCVHAVRPIAKGEEITLSYIPGGPSATRKEILKEDFGFECICEVCASPTQASDERLLRAAQLDEKIGDSRRVRRDPTGALRDCRDLLRIFDEEKIVDLRLPRAYHDAFQICAMHGDQARASIFAERGRELRVMLEGPESVEAERLAELVEDPTKFEKFGLTTRWDSEVQSVPKDVSEEAFEGWLWRESVA